MLNANILKQDYDILIVGAGVVGSSLALALSNLPLRIALIEKKPFKEDAKLSDNLHNDKPIALNAASIQILQTLSLWPALLPCANPIESVHISQQGYFAQSRINAKQLGIPQLGYVVPAAGLGAECTKALIQCSINKIPKAASLDLFNPAQCQAINKLPQTWEVTFTQQQEKFIIYPRLIVAADGSDSTVRKLLNIGIKISSETKAALVATLTMSCHHQHIAYQRFTDSGIIACLPLVGNKIGLVWTATKPIIDALPDLLLTDFVEKLQQHFNYRFGKLNCDNKPQIYPLKSFIAEIQAQPGLVLLGNAAHTLLPVAAQGLNLALQDMSVLADIIADSLLTKKDVAGAGLSHAYLNARLSIQKQIIGFTEQLEQLQTRFKPLTFIYNNGLLAMDILPVCKRSLSRRLMGTHGRLSRLIRGLTLEQEEY